MEFPLISLSEGGSRTQGYLGEFSVIVSITTQQFAGFMRFKNLRDNFQIPGLSKRASTFVGLALATSLLLVFVKYGLEHVTQPIDRLVSILENSYTKLLSPQSLQQPLFLIPVAFAGGLLASISPCILAMLPINLSYIGTRNITSRWDALGKASGFVLGVVTVLSVMGLFSGLQSALIVDYKGYFYVGVGLLIVLMGASFAGLFKLPLPTKPINIPIAGPFGVGLTFALVSSPCASPVLVAILAAAAASGSTFWSVMTMVSYALGYTAIIFFSSLFAGLLKLRGSLLEASDSIVRWGGWALVVMGGYYLVTGLQWFNLFG
jgi:cytochrome c-type biogenesis protein